MTKTLIARPEHKGTSSKIKTNEKITGLFTGVSAAALMLGAFGNQANAAGITITDSTTDVIIGATKSFDFIDIEAPVIFDVVNQGNIGIGSPAIIVDGPNGGFVGGDIINSGTISGTKGGIVIAGTKLGKGDPLGGNIINNGQINVAAATKGPSSAFGIVISGASVFSSVSNNATLNVNATATGGSGTHTAVGVQIISGGNMVTQVNNDGIMDVEVIAPSGTGSNIALAAGVAGIGLGTASSASNVVVNSGLMEVDAFASGTTGGSFNLAAAAGAFHLVGASSGASNNFSFSNTASATLDVFAVAGTFATSGAGSNVAIGLGVVQGGFGGASINQNITNNGDFDVFAGAADFFLADDQNAFAVGTLQIALGTGGTGNISQNMTNSLTGSLFVEAIALAGSNSGLSANAVALAAPQLAFGGASATLNLSNSGDLTAVAKASAIDAFSANANALAAGAIQGASGSGNHDLTVSNSIDGSINVFAMAHASKAFGASANAGGFTGTTLLGGFFSGIAGVSQNAFGSGDHSLTLNNSGGIDVGAAAFASKAFFASANASAVGVSQAAGGGTDIDMMVNNDGGIDVFVSANAASASSAGARAIGKAIHQTVTGASSSANIDLAINNLMTVNGTGTGATTQTGSINVTVNAQATGPGAYAGAGAGDTQPAFLQDAGTVTTGSTVNIDLTNQGNIGLTYNAQATGTSAFAQIGVDGRRVSIYWQEVDGLADTAAGNISNASGAVISHNGVAFASGSGPSVTASVSVVGGWQSIDGGQNVSANFSNNGTFNVGALATAQGESPFASAEVDSGVYQNVDANGGAGSNATATITNTSLLSINLNATANATGSNSALATAQIDGGIWQYANGETASASVNNSGAFNMGVKAFASATVTGNASANATIDSGVSQTATADQGDFLSAMVDLTNSGVFNLSATASAFAPGSASASANIDVGFHQSADGGDVATVSVVNTSSGNFNFNANAYAQGSKAVALANNSTHLFEQSASADDDNLVASATIDNDGYMGMQLNATAIGTDGTGGPGTNASAYAYVSYAFEQFAYEAADASVLLDNSGTIYFGIDLLASNASSAYIFYSFDTGFYQNATGNSGTSDVASATLINSGDIIIDFEATAIGTSNASVDANPYYFVEQYVDDASVVSANFTNTATGNIDVDVFAFASATSSAGFATANADFSYGWSGTADASAGDQASAAVNFTNDGNITFDITASAQANSASAYAGVGSFIYYTASGGDDSSITFSNTGDLIVNLNAYALASDADASASVDDYGFYLSADADDDETSATSTFTNSATGTIIFDANATAMGTDGTGGPGTSAYAFASIEYGLYQYAFDGISANASINNDGTLSFLVNALASNAENATATASIGTGIYQSATGIGGGGSSTVNASITNTSVLSLNFMAQAQAYGSTYAYANVEQDDYLVYQDVSDGDFVSVDFTNSGAFNALYMATAVASNGSAYAYAEIDSGVSQNANANGGSNDSATVDFTNTSTGTINMLAYARASAFGTTVNNDTASASATIDDLFDQDVDNAADVISASFTNDGEINATAMANALGGDAYAYAYLDDELINQDVDNNTSNDQISSTATIANAGAVNLLVQAVAMGTNGTGGAGLSATATATYDTIISQEASDSLANSISITNSNTGVFDFQAIAVASNASDVYAYAYMSYAFYQNVEGSSNVGSISADALFQNDGSINILAFASGQAANSTGGPGTDASVEVTIDYPFEQYAHSALNGTATFINNGDIDVAATAIAGNASDAYAFASVSYFLSQTAEGDSAEGSTATATITNTSLTSMDVTIRAQASGVTDADATAEMEYYIYQSAEDADVLNATINNTGAMNLDMIAMANAAGNGTTGYAYASVDIGYGIYQEANGHSGFNPLTSNATIDNSGVIDFLLYAKATGTTRAYAYVEFDDSIVYQSADGAGVATALIDNSGAFDVVAMASASASAGNATASVYFDYPLIYQYAFADDGSQLTASATINNSGDMSLVGVANAVGTTDADAYVFQTSYGIYQSATAGVTGTTTGSSASVEFNNSSTGTVSFVAMANATGLGAYASASFSDARLYQTADASSTPGSTASATFNNDGSLTAVGQATAIGTDGSGGPGTKASAYAYMETFLEQYSFDALNSTALIDNNGTLAVLLSANASNASDAYASAYLSYGIYQTGAGGNTAGSTATATINNTSNTTLDFTLQANALGVTSASAHASIHNELIYQGATDAEVVSGLIDNNGLIAPNSGSFNVDLDATAIALGNGTTGYAFASAYMNTGVYQYANANAGASLSANIEFRNTGSIVFDFDALASGTTQATANAYLNTAFWQEADDGASVDLLFNNNTGSIALLANAKAVGGTYALATATATKVWQTVNPTTANVSNTLTFNNKNSASFVVNANAQAQNTGGATASAYAFAGGVSQDNDNATNNPSFNAVFFNANEDNFKNEPASLFQVKAFASASGGSTNNVATASAIGYQVIGDVDTNPVLDVTNNSTFRVHATAVGDPGSAAATAIGMSFTGGKIEGTVVNGGLIDVQASAQSGSASAVGFVFDADVNNTTFINTGTINILAIGSTTAIGLGYVDNFETKTKTTYSPDAFTATSGDLATFINDGGTVWAGENNGTLDFGTALDTTGAPNAVLIDLRGTTRQGNIWGNIEISGDDNIWVNNGKTMFTGNVNSGGTMVGDLTIGSGGTLTLASTGTGGAQVNVDEYTQSSTGTIMFNVTPSTPISGLGQVYAGMASLAGTVGLNITPGLYANSQTYQDVVVASSSLSGTYGSTLINTNTPLLSLTAIYPGDGTVDLALTRNSFASPAGLTINQMNAGLGLDGGYSTALTGAFGSMISNLFTLSSAAYVGALEQLHGSEHVQNLRTNLWSMNLLNYALDERVNAGAFSNDRTDNSDSVIRRGETTFWASYQGTTGDLEGDIEASGYKITQDGFYAGFDHSITDDILVGFAAGFYRSRLNFTNGSDKDDEGVQLAVYGAYDNQDFYIRGNFALGYYNADSNRMINLPTQIGTARGDYNVDVMSFHAEAGKRLELSENAYVTPFLGFTYASAKNNVFSETGTTGANLALPENKVKSFSGDIGARFAASYDTGSNSIIIPEVSVRYRHEFKDEVLSINSSFAAASGSGFSVISSHVDNGQFIVGGGVRFSQGDKLEISLMYSGRFNSQITEHGIGLRLSLLLGDRK